jgi:radical SAM protein with 4Fe4S-binding SPASM domain
MYALKDNIAVGYNNGRVVLIDMAHTLPTKYLSYKSSVLLFAILNMPGGVANADFFSKITGQDNTGQIEHAVQNLIEELYNHLCTVVACPVGGNQKVLLGHLHKPDGSPVNNFRLDYPVKLVWVPTWKCNNDCLYCGVKKINTSVYEKRIPFSVVFGRIRDAVEKGVRSVTIHGGEPLFYYDDENIYELINFLSQNNIYTEISTKNRITPEKASSLKRAGLKRIQLSIDTCDPVLAKSLYRNESHIDNFIESVTNLDHVDIGISVNIVISSLNFNHIIGLLYFLQHMGIKEVSLSVFKEGSINPSKLSLSNEQGLWLASELDKNKSKIVFNKLHYTPFGSSVVHSCNRAVCESGRVSLLILPGGEYCYCDFLSNNTKFIFGNIKENTIGEAWNSVALKQLVYPSHESYRNSKCNNCVGLGNCLERGFCYLSMDLTRNFTPDYKCTECFN